MTKKRKETYTFRLHVIEEGDPSVGIPGGEGPISITVPDWFVPHGDESTFESGLADFLTTWTDGGKILTSAQKLERDEAIERADKALEGI